VLEKEMKYELTKYFNVDMIGKRLPTSFIVIKRYPDYEKNIC